MAPPVCLLPPYLPRWARKEPWPPLDHLPGPSAPCEQPRLILYAHSRGLFKLNKSGGVFYLPSQVVLVVMNLPANAGMSRDVGSIPGSGRSLGEGTGNPLQYYCLENHMDRGAWRATVHGVAELDTLKQLSTHAYEHMHNFYYLKMLLEYS